MPEDALPKVFVVDDERVIAETLSKILARNGFVTRTFFDGREALRAAETEAPDLLLSDVIMPYMTGVELAIALRRLYPRCKVVLFSGQANTEDLLLDARRQGYEFLLLSKPVHPLELLRQLGENGFVQV